MEANIESYQGLERNLAEQGYDISKVPMVMQWNKRDLPNIVPVEDLQFQLNKRKFPAFEAVATNGQGVFETLKMVSKSVLLNIKGGLE
jgi:signal recognition particle receptor subunit beta